MEETAGDPLIVEGRVDRVGREHHGERQKPARDALGEAEKIRRDSRLLAGEHRAGAAESDHDFIGDQMHIVAVANLARAAQVERIVHGHAPRALHQRLDDERGGARVMLCEMRFQRVGGARRALRGRFAVTGVTPVG